MSYMSYIDFDIKSLDEHAERNKSTFTYTLVQCIYNIM